MKALSVQPYWADLFLCGKKEIECRTWKTSHRGDVILCSSSKKEPGCICGHALLICNLFDIVSFEQKHLKGAAMDSMPDKPAFAWMFDNFRIIYPVPVKGKLGLFDLDINIEYLPEDITESEIISIYDPITA